MTKGSGPAAGPDVVILAEAAGGASGAGLGPMHPVFFRPMLHYALDAVGGLAHRSASVFVAASHESEVGQLSRGYPDLAVIPVEADSPLLEGLRALPARLGSSERTVLIVCADAVLLATASLQGLLGIHESESADCTVAAAVEGEGGPPACCFSGGSLAAVLEGLRSRRAQGHGGLSEAVAASAARGGTERRFQLADPVEGLRVSDPYGLSEAERVLQERRNRSLMRSGVILRDPRTTQVDAGSRIAPGVRIGGGTTVLNSVIEAAALVEDHCRVVDSEVGARSRLKQGSRVEQSRVGRDCRVGGSVELTDAILGAATRVGSLSFIEDAIVGRNVTIGTGFITCGAGGRLLKQRTVIEDGVFIGSASQAIAPVTLGAGSFIATGTSISADVPPGAFVISRGRQVTKPDGARKFARAAGALKPGLTTP